MVEDSEFSDLINQVAVLDASDSARQTKVSRCACPKFVRQPRHELAVIRAGRLSMSETRASQSHQPTWCLALPIS